MHVRISGLTKRYGRSLLDQAIAAGVAAFGLRPPAGRRFVAALQDVSLEIGEGERVGIIGANGAGKSTLLHIVAGLARPTSGRVDVGGEVTCILTLGVGIRDELSGRENIYLDAEARGRSRAEIEPHLDDIVEFADIGAFIDHPVRTYSTGMKVRLAFAMIVSAHPEILIVDEALSAGDLAFARKAGRRMKELAREGGITIVVSHDMESIRELCDRCLWLEGGRLRMDGTPDEVTGAYLASVRERADEVARSELSRHVRTESFCEGVEVQPVALLTDGIPTMALQSGDPLAVQVRVRSERRLLRPDLRLTITRADGLLLVDSRASETGFECGPIDGTACFELPYGRLDLGSGVHEVGVEILDLGAPEGARTLAATRSILRVQNPQSGFGDPAWVPEFSWRVAPATEA